MRYLRNLVDGIWPEDRSVWWLLALDVVLAAVAFLMLVIWHLHLQHNEGG